MTVDHGTLKRASVALLFFLTTAIFLRMIWGFVLAVFVAAIFTGMAYPLYVKLLRLLGGRKELASATTLVLLVVLVVTPFVLIADLVVMQAVEVSQTLEPWIDQQMEGAGGSGHILDRLPFGDRLEAYQGQIAAKLGEIAASVSSMVVSALSAVTRGTVSFFFQLFILLYSMFFFLVFGPEILQQIRRLIPLDDNDQDLLLDKFVSVSRATLKGTGIIGIIQGGLAGGAFAVAGISGAVFWGAVMTILSIIPGIGTALVWIPAVIYLLSTGRTGPAIALALWCAVVVGTADNFLRPMLVGKDTQMPGLMVMLSTFGGLAMFGAVGFIIGPVIASLFLAAWKIYSDTFGEVLESSG